MTLLPLLLLFMVFSIPLLLVRSQKEFFWTVLILGGFLGMVWLDHFEYTLQPGYDPGFSGALGIAFFAIVTLVFILISIGRYFGLRYQNKGWSRKKSLLLDFLPLVIFIIISILTTFLNEQQSEFEDKIINECTNKEFEAEIGNIQLKFPSSPLVSLYKNTEILFNQKSDNENIYYLKYKSDMAKICKETDYGKNYLDNLGTISINIDNYNKYDLYHDKDIKADELYNTMCNEQNDCTLRELVVFEDNFKQKGSFGWTDIREKYKTSRKLDNWKDNAFILEENQQVRRYADNFIMFNSNEHEEVSIPIGFCDVSYDDIYHCEVTQALPDKQLLLYWSYAAKADELSKKFLDSYKVKEEILNLIAK